MRRIEILLEQLSSETDAVNAAALRVSRIARSQAFSEGNKRTALLVGRWILDRNELDGRDYIPDDDMALAELLLQAARGTDISDEVVRLFNLRRR